MKPLKAKAFGIIGYPVKHSLSPLMHNAAFASLGIAAEYRLFELREAELESFLKNLGQNNIYGLNVTVPYKEKVIPFLSVVSAEARLIGAVNTIKVKRDKLAGFNTDGEGFIRHLSNDLKFQARAKNIALIGAGGAARAVAVYLSKEQPKSIAIYDIDQNRSQGLIKHLKENFSAIDFKLAPSVSALNIKDCSLLVNAAPIGMKESDPCLIDENSIHSNLLVYDLIYNPAETKLLALAKKKGCAASSGLGMLLYQGARSFEIWTGLTAPLEVMRRALNQGVKNL